VKRRFRLGRHQLDIAVEAARDRQHGPVDERLVREERDAPIDVVAADPFRLRNILLVPSALFVVLGALLRYESGWFLLLLALGVGGIGAWEVLRRHDKRKGS
jgi:hypothetical protein